MANHIETIDAICGTGKALTLDSKLVTPYGYVEMREAYVGMKIYGEDGSLHSITGVFPQGERDCYRMIFSDGTEVLCSDDHIWTVQLPQDIVKGKSRNYTTKELLSVPLFKKNKEYKNWQVWLPLTKSIEIEEREVSIDPYILGLLLGDGMFKTQIVFSNTESDLKNKMEKYANHMGDSFIEKPIDNRIRGGNILKEIRNYGLKEARSESKFIPEDYKYNSVDVRLRVLQGLIDSDGYTMAGAYEYTTVSKQLCEDVQWLVHSLGGYCNCVEREVGYTKDGKRFPCKNSFRMYIKPPRDMVFHLSEKHSKRFKAPNTAPRRSIRSIEYVGKLECQCISVDNPTKLFLTNGFIPTHNTHSIIEWMKRNPKERYIYISPMLSEVEERIPKECLELGFKFPCNKDSTKAEDLLELLSEGHNVAFTHSLYTKLTKQHIQYIKDFEYTIIIDEEMTLIEPLRTNNSDNEKLNRLFYSNSDIKYLLESKHIEIDENDFGRIVWKWEDYGSNAVYTKLKALCEMGMLYYNNSNDENKVGGIVVQIPIEMIKSCKRCIAISYLMEGSIMEQFLKMKGIPMVPFDMQKEGVELRFSNQDVKQHLKSLINFVETLPTNKLKTERLSYSWYVNKNFSRDDAKAVSAAIRSVCIACKVNYTEVMWTVPKYRAFSDNKTKIVIKPQGFSAKNCYVYSGCRATNDFNHKSTLIHALYRQPNVVVTSYLSKYGFPVDIDNFVLSELIQWVFRSRIREGKPINLSLIPSKMKTLFDDWLNSL